MIGADSLRRWDRVTEMARAVGLPALAGLIIVTLVGVQPSAGREAQCVNIFHDEVYEGRQKGPINAIMLANLLGHWPQYEIRVRPIGNYQSADAEACKATFYLGTLDDAEIPETFLADFFRTQKRIAWIGFGVRKLNAKWLEQAFHHRVSGLVTVDDQMASNPRFYQYVSYKGNRFRKDIGRTSNGKPEGAFEAVRFVPVGADAGRAVLAHLIHNGTNDSIPYFLRADNRFLVGDIPFAYVHEADRYFAFADLLFDVLDEQPLRQTPLAFARVEDIHGFYDRELLRAAFAAMHAEGVPISIAHIPLFMDPFNVYGRGNITNPVPAYLAPGFTRVVHDLVRDKRNAILWHGTTHQFGRAKNPNSGASGADYEFWDAVAQKPVDGDGVAFTFNRLAEGLRVFERYHMAPRYWETPHYQASAVNNRVFGAVFPWVVGQVTYYASSFKPTFTLNAADARTSDSVPSVTRQLLVDRKNREWRDLDPRSEDGESQMFPFEIYRDVYGQRIIPETLGYLSFAVSDQTDFIRTPEHMLADAQRNLVVRDYWASFFFHPYLFASRDKGGIGQRHGDTSELRKLLSGLKLLGYQFVGLSEFEASVPQRSRQQSSAGP